MIALSDSDCDAVIRQIMLMKKWPTMPEGMGLDLMRETVRMTADAMQKAGFDVNRRAA